MVTISWQIVLAVIGVIVGFVVTDRILEKRGYGVKGKASNVSIDNLAEFLREKYLVNVAIVSEENKIAIGVDDFEIDEMRTALEVSRSDEILRISNSDYKYAVKRGNVFIYLHGKFISLEDFSQVWTIVQNALRGVRT
ncbi:MULTISPECIES: hypothetical protein [unclassified Archaeoglobus]|uniref:hypothetical protein n=1 Tax=unclassified Archaeoglobus TaxID=2643606 RepID=UPI0025B9D955|nr:MULTISPECIES: hypothetical protein [unclassified Archaeoglobus]